MKSLVITPIILVVASASAHAAPVLRSTSGADAASIQATVNAFRADLGGANNGVGGGPFFTGRREINWDAAGLDGFQSPALMPDNFFNRVPPPAGSPRGALFSTPGQGFLVSQRVAQGSGENLRFGDISPQYDNEFKVFSESRLFAVSGSLVMDTTFFVPGQTSVPATVNGFGAVFADVDLENVTKIEFFDLSNMLIHSAFAPAADKGLSFVGVSFDQGERIARVRLTLGNEVIGGFDGFGDFGTQDVVVMDDFIYGEPIPTPGGAILCLAAGAMGVRRRR